MKCSATTKAGKPCRAQALKGSKRCGVHDPSSSIYPHFAVGHEALSPGRPHKLGSAQALALAIQERADELLAVAVKLALAGNTQMIQTLLAYGWCKPRQSLELTGDGGGPITLAQIAAAPLDDPG